MSRPAEAAPVTRARKWLEAHLGERLTMRAVAREVHLNPCYFCRLFRKSTGLRFTEYVCRARIERAKQLSCGFGDLSYFNRTFKKCVGVTPTVYRRARGWRRRGASRGRASQGGTAKSSKKKSILP